MWWKGFKTEAAFTKTRMNNQSNAYLFKIVILAFSTFIKASYSVKLIAYQLSWVIYCQRYPCTRTAIIFFNPQPANQGVHTFPKGICKTVNLIERLEFEPSNYETAVQYISYHARWGYYHELFEQIWNTSFYIAWNYMKLIKWRPCPQTTQDWELFTM